MRRAFVIGDPIAHSRSPLIHGHWLSDLRLAGSYERVRVSPEELTGFLARLASDGWSGGNVTLPHKESTFAHLRQAGAVLTEEACSLRAVNTLWLEGGLLHGDNTDGHGFAASLDDEAPGWNVTGGRAVVLGAGGGARAIVATLLRRGMAGIVLVNRDRERASEVARSAPGRIVVADWPDVADALAGADLLVNTTQLGMAGQPPLALDLAPLPDHAVVADIVYVPLTTQLLADAKARGLRTVDGLGMLLHQAVPGFRRWFGETPRVTPALRARLVADLERAP